MAVFLSRKMAVSDFDFATSSTSIRDDVDFEQHFANSR
jgi:hypothetical protein